LANAGIPLGANTTFIYGDLLIPPLIAIYNKSFPPRVVRAFLGLFVIGALLAGAVMEIAIGNVFGGMSMGSMALNDRITLVSNIAGLLALAFVFVASRAARSEARS
jgi:predicted lipid-binding transport protein (Tim44 family)